MGESRRERDNRSRSPLAFSRLRGPSVVGKLDKCLAHDATSAADVALQLEGRAHRVLDERVRQAGGQGRDRLPAGAVGGHENLWARSASAAHGSSMMGSKRGPVR